MRVSRLTACSILSLIYVAISGCSISISSTPGSGVIVTETREIDDFTGIVCSGSGKLVVTQANEVSLKITCDDDLMDNVQSTVENGNLVLRTTGNVRPTQLKYEVTCPKLVELNHSGSGASQISNFTEGSLNLRQSGSGKTTLVNHHGTALHIKTSGSGGVGGEGSVESVSADISGSGSLNLSKINAAKAKTKISGSGGIDIHASESFSGTITGSGGITVHGNPVDKNESVTGSGKITFVE